MMLGSKNAISDGSIVHGSEVVDPVSRWSGCLPTFRVNQRASDLLPSDQQPQRNAAVGSSVNWPLATGYDPNDLGFAAKGR